MEKRKAEAAHRDCDLLTFEIEIKKDGSGAGWIYSPEMKCEFPSRSVIKDVAVLTGEFIQLMEAYP
jgi:hypothetical protein